MTTGSESAVIKRAGFIVFLLWLLSLVASTTASGNAVLAAPAQPSDAEKTLELPVINLAAQTSPLSLDAKQELLTVKQTAARTETKTVPTAKSDPNAPKCVTPQPGSSLSKEAAVIGVDWHIWADQLGLKPPTYLIRAGQQICYDPNKTVNTQQHSNAPPADASKQVSTDPVKLTAVTKKQTPPPAKPVAPVTTGSSSKAQKVVSLVKSMVGHSYVWGAAGPSAFDCSGLALWAYKQVGINLPHSSAVQSTMGKPVSKSDLQPGDLVFYYSPVSHIAIYIGDGKVVSAESTKTGVVVRTVDGAGPFHNARRFL